MHSCRRFSCELCSPAPCLLTCRRKLQISCVPQLHSCCTAFLDDTWRYWLLHILYIWDSRCSCSSLCLHRLSAARPESREPSTSLKGCSIGCSTSDVLARWIYQSLPVVHSTGSVGIDNGASGQSKRGSLRNMVWSMAQVQAVHSSLLYLAIRLRISFTLVMQTCSLNSQGPHS